MSVDTAHPSQSLHAPTLSGFLSTCKKLQVLIERVKSQVKSAAESFPALRIKFLRRRSFTVAQINEL